MLLSGLPRRLGSDQWWPLGIAYLAAVYNMHILLQLTSPRESSSLLVLKRSRKGLRGQNYQKNTPSKARFHNSPSLGTLLSMNHHTPNGSHTDNSTCGLHRISQTGRIAARNCRGLQSSDLSILGRCDCRQPEETHHCEDPFEEVKVWPVWVRSWHHHWTDTYLSLPCYSGVELQCHTSSKPWSIFPGHKWIRPLQRPSL